MIDYPPILHTTLAGRYVLKREIGRGGAATVYLAHDIRHERLVAVKLLHAELSHALGAQRFLREIKLTASLQHPHILPIHDSGEIDDQLYYVMPYVEGDTMRQRLGADNRLSLEEAVRIGREVAGALAYAHERGVVHRDIKPENILFSGGHAVLADFGIARAIDRAHEKITQQGMITGTPAYMSPEQARDRAFDGRSDVYSLACVLYEAIAGVPPFVGDTPQQLLTQRISRPAPLLREYRHDVPPPIETVIAKALSMSPDDRFDDARAFSAALSAAIGNSGETSTMRPARRQPLWSSPWAWAAGLTLFVGGAAATSPRGRDEIDLLTGRIDTAQYAIVPFQYVGTPTPADAQEPVSQGLYTAMAEWSGLKVASDFSVIDAIHRTDNRTLSGVMTVARRARAGKLVWGRVSLMGRDSVRVRAGIYDALDGSSLREVTVTQSRSALTASPALFQSLVLDLLRLDGAPASARLSERGTRSIAAWREYQEGQRALAAWQVSAALAHFGRATEADPAFAAPHVWLAQLLVWRDSTRTVWAPHAAAAARNQVTLGGVDSAVAEAVIALARDDFGAAAATYEAMHQRDTMDVVASLGLAYSIAYDARVVRDAGSATGWAFRGSVAAAQRAYTHALQVAPPAFGALPFEALTRRLFVVESSHMRRGRAADSSDFMSLPDLVGDSIAYRPRPLAQSNLPFALLAPHYDLALARNRERLLGLLSMLVQRLPDNPDVFESLASVLEMRDEITGTPNGGYSALSALERAKQLATDSVQRARIGAHDVRLHLKMGDFSRTAAIAESLLTAHPRATGGVAAELIGVAALLGREHDAIRYARDGGQSMLPFGAPSVPLLEEITTALFMRAAVGACDDSLRALRRRTEVLIESYVSASQRTVVRDYSLALPLRLAVGCFGAQDMLTLAAPMGALAQVIKSVGRGDLPAARSALDSLQARRSILRPGQYALDFTLTEAWIRLATGDTAAAIKRLDLTLTALPTLAPGIVDEPAMAGAVGRSMALRAELAFRQHDQGSAALWASRVLTLWKHADPSVSPTVARMKLLAAQRS